MHKLLICFSIITVFLLSLFGTLLFSAQPILIKCASAMLLLLVAIPAFGLIWSELAPKLRQENMRNDKPALYYLGFLFGIPLTLLGLALLIIGIHGLIGSIYLLFANTPGYETFTHWYMPLLPIALMGAGALCIIYALRKEQKKNTLTPTEKPASEQNEPVEATQTQQNSSEKAPEAPKAQETPQANPATTTPAPAPTVSEPPPTAEETLQDMTFIETLQSKPETSIETPPENGFEETRFGAAPETFEKKEEQQRQAEEDLKEDSKNELLQTLSDFKSK